MVFPMKNIGVRHKVDALVFAVVMEVAVEASSNRRSELGTVGLCNPRAPGLSLPGHAHVFQTPEVFVWTS